MRCGVSVGSLVPQYLHDVVSMSRGPHSHCSGSARVPWIVRGLQAIDRIRGGNRVYATAFQLFGDDSLPGTYDAELEPAFFRAIKLSNGTFKTTSAARLCDLNELVEKHLPARRPLSIKDVAVSSGVSTAEWSEQLRDRGIEHRMTATDLTISALLVSITDRLRILFDKEGAILQIDMAGYPVYPRLSRRLDRSLAGLPSRLAGWFAARQLAMCVRPRAGASPSVVRQLELVTPRLRELGIEVKEEDLSHPHHSQERWDVIRAANILNRAYFASEVLLQMLRGLVGSLEVGGILVVCRTESDGTNHGSVWRLQPDRSLERLGRIGRGSEIEDILDGRSFAL
jgi:hypothetical protein